MTRTEVYAAIDAEQASLDETRSLDGIAAKSKLLVDCLENMKSSLSRARTAYGLHVSNEPALREILRLAAHVVKCLEVHGGKP